MEQQHGTRLALGRDDAAFVGQMAYRFLVKCPQRLRTIQSLRNARDLVQIGFAHLLHEGRDLPRQLLGRLREPKSQDFKLTLK